MSILYLLQVLTLSRGFACALGLNNSFVSEILGKAKDSFGRGNFTDIDKARVACDISERLFVNQPQGTGDVPDYVGPQSQTYINRTEVNWYGPSYFCLAASCHLTIEPCHRSDNCWQNASCIVAPKNSEDLGHVLLVITSLGSKFSVRSGGHDFNVNHSSVSQVGVLIDMVNFDQVDLNDDKSLVTLGTGVRWGKVYQILNGTGVSVDGGRSPEPAVGGQLLGGKQMFDSSWKGVRKAFAITFARRNWMVRKLQGCQCCEYRKRHSTEINLSRKRPTNFEKVMLANSSVVHVSADSHPDLLWALKGGGPNFGKLRRLLLCRKVRLDGCISSTC